MDALSSHAWQSLAAAFRRFGRRYSHLFSIQEIEDTTALQWYFGASLFFFFLVFNEWITTALATIESAARGVAVCWPYFQHCTDYYFLQGLSEGYGKNIFYMALYGIMCVIVWCMWRRHWIAAHALLTVLFIWEAIMIFVFVYSINAPYYYYHLFLTAALLFVPFKEYFLKLIFVVCYFASATIKIDSTWILGTYFTSLEHGLPLLPKALTPIFTNIVILSQIAGCWFLLSRNRVYQRIALIFFATFHLYSGFFVYYMYPSTSLLPLLILFGPLYRHTPTPFAWRALAGWIIVAGICIFQVLGFVVPAEQRILTLEGNRFGMFMFEANHQCIITQKVYSTHISAYSADRNVAPGTPCTDFLCVVKSKTSVEGSLQVRETVLESGASYYRCDPYEQWVRIQALCKIKGVQRVSLQFDHSVNGGPFYRIVDEEDMCGVEYQPFRHNEWIKIPPEAPAVGRPVENIYHS